MTYNVLSGTLSLYTTTMRVLYSCCGWMQGADRPWPDKQWALCIFDDLLEHTGPVRFDVSCTILL